MDPKNDNVYNFFWNFFDEVFMKLNVRCVKIKERITNAIKETDLILILLFAVLLFTSISAVLFFSCLIIYITTEKDQILFLFLDINQNYVNLLYGKCEKFLSSYVVLQTF